MRVLKNGVATTLAAPLSSGSTAPTFALPLTYNGGTAVPTLTAGDYMPLSILDADGNLVELVHLTAYTTAATTGTIVRGRAGTTAVAHSAGALVVSAATTHDLLFSPLKPENLHPSYGDDFTDPSLSAIWTRNGYNGGTDEVRAMGAGGSFMQIKPMRPTGNYYRQTVSGLTDFTALFGFIHYGSNDAYNPGLFASDASGNGLASTLSNAGSSMVLTPITGFNASGSPQVGFGGGGQSQLAHGEYIQLALKRTGNDWFGAMSVNGQAWSPWNTTPISSSFTVTRLGFGVFFGTPNSGSSLFQVDYFDVLVTVYATSDTGALALGSALVGWSADWPQESIDDRVDRIVAECPGMTRAMTLLGTGLEGTLGARAAASGPVSVYRALRDALDQGALENTSEFPDTFYGRPVIGFVYEWDGFGEDPGPISGSLYVWAFERRVYGTTTLDGCKVKAELGWRKLPGGTIPQWAIVDGTTFGTPSGPPAVVRTSLVDTTPSNPSAVTRDNLGESLLPDGSTQLEGYYAQQVRYIPAADDATEARDLAQLVTGWASHDPIHIVQPVVITDLDPDYQLNGVDYLAGTLTGARLVLPAGGRFYLDLRLRPELLPGTDLT